MREIALIMRQLLQGSTPFSRRMQCGDILLQVPPLSQNLGLLRCCEQLGVEELIPESVIEQLHMDLFTKPHRQTLNELLGTEFG
jgi:hypothetical protein